MNPGSEEREITNQTKGYRVYQIKGLDKTIVARKGGPSAQQVKSDKNYQQLRNNQKEFGVASMMSKVLRKSLSDSMMEICETYASGKLTAEFRNLTKLEEGKTGTRPMILSKHGYKLCGFEFNPEAPYKKIFGAKYYVKAGSRRGQIILHFPSFIPEEAFSRPEDATNFKIVARLIALSDFTFDPKQGTYRPKNEDVHGSFGSYESPMLPLLKIPMDPMTAQLSVNKIFDVSPDMGLFLVMAVSFYRYENGRFIHLAKSSSMKIEQVY
jgi:hypothetical protein